MPLNYCNRHKRIKVESTHTKWRGNWDGYGLQVKEQTHVRCRRRRGSEKPSLQDAWRYEGRRVEENDGDWQWRVEVVEKQHESTKTFGQTCGCWLDDVFQHPPQSLSLTKSWTAVMYWNVLSFEDYSLHEESKRQGYFLLYADYAVALGPQTSQRASKLQVQP